MEHITWNFSECIGKDVYDYVVKSQPQRPKCLVEPIHNKQERYGGSVGGCNRKQAFVRDQSISKTYVS